MAEVKASVIIPVYNVEKYLRECLDSVTRQTLNDIEVICVDDGSTDGSLKILQEYTEKDKRIKVVSQQNKGAGTARNRGLTLAKGKYLYFMDSDDYCDKELLKKTVDMAEETGADIVAFHYYVFDEQGNMEKRNGYQKGKVPAVQKVISYRDLPDCIMSFINPTPWNKLYRRSFVENAGIRFEEISSTNDITFAGVSVAMAEKVALLNENLLYYRKGHSGTITSKKTKNLNNVFIAVESAVRQAEKIPYKEEILSSIRRFAVGNLYFGMKNYVQDIRTAMAEEYYNNVRQLFHEELFAGTREGELGPAEYYDFFCAVKQTEYEKMRELYKARLIVSVTSFPERIPEIIPVLESIFQQTKQADLILLYLAREQFPKGEEELPEKLRKLISDGSIVLKWCDDLMPHKKYFYAMQEYPDDIIVTIDDDLLYDPKMLELLYQSYLRYPEAISAMRAHIMGVTSTGKIMPYEVWVKEYAQYTHKLSMWLFVTTGAGTLFPPSWRPRMLFDKEAVLKTCLRADDLWVNVCRIMTHTPVAVVKDSGKLKRLKIENASCLYELNGSGGMNDTQLNAICEYLGIKEELPAILLAEKDKHTFCGEEFLYYEMMRMKKEYEKQLGSKNKQISKEKKKYNDLVKSRSYKLIKAMKKIYKYLFRR